ncbi:MAG: M13 family peptidase, partial [Pseudomonadota bacterium]
MTSFPRRLVSQLLLAGILAVTAVAKPPGIDLAGMNPAIAPGDDFYAYANGTWMAATEIPADRSNWGSGAALGEETNERLAALLRALAEKRELASPVERIAAD